MQRVIKFRGKRTDNEKWVYGYYFATPIACYKIRTQNEIPFNNEPNRRQHIIVDETGNIFEVKPETIGQFTGFYANNAEIYEDDIFSVNGTHLKLVKFIDDKAAFCMANLFELKEEDWLDIWHRLPTKWWSDFKHEITVVDNIHDNPELITTTENNDQQTKN